MGRWRSGAEESRREVSEAEAVDTGSKMFASAVLRTWLEADIG